MDTAVATAVGSSIPWLYLCTALLSFVIWIGRTFQLCAKAERRPAEPSFTAAVLPTGLPPFQIGFCTESELSLLYFHSTPSPRL